jgi:ribosomal protein L7/L12
MKLTDFDNNSTAQKALTETYAIPFNVQKMPLQTAASMLTKVRKLTNEAKQSTDFYKNQTNPSYMKLVFMEQALNSHLYNLKNSPKPRIVVENEEVEKSQVILAAQDMIDTVQKMLEEVSDMMVKELPALVNSIQSEMGVNESTQFNAQATEALTSLSSSIQQSRTTLTDALNMLTGQTGQDAFAMDAQPEMAPPEEEVQDINIDTTEVPVEEPEPQPVGGVGRLKR